MRYIGSKKKLTGFIVETIDEVVGATDGLVVADLFSGTATVAESFKQANLKVISNDYMTFSYVLQRARIVINEFPKFEGLGGVIDSNVSYDSVLSYLNLLEGAEGFLFKNYTTIGTSVEMYSRNYFSSDNAKLIDAIRIQIEIWRQLNVITEDEFYLLLASLIEAVTKVSNTSGTYGAFLKVDDPRKFNDLILKKIEIFESDKIHRAYNEDIFDVIKKINGDILYLDPPYNNRQYPAYYHILETIALYDNPAIYGLTGRRPYEDMKSPFCMKKLARNAMQKIVSEAKFNHVFISYSTDGIITVEEMYELLAAFGEPVVFDKEHRRYKSNSFVESDNKLKELLFYVRKEIV